MLGRRFRREFASFMPPSPSSHASSARRSPAGTAGRWLVLALSFLLAACGATEMSPREKRQVGRILNARRDTSLAAWQGKTIQGAPATDYAELRTAVLVPRRSPVLIAFQPESQTYHVQVRRGRRGMSLGSAAAISADGYYLTAAHCVEDGPLQLVALGADRRPHAVPARLVWRGKGPDNGQADLAVVHAPTAPAGHFPLADPTTLRRGTTVLTSGFGQLRPTQSGGRVLRLEPPKTDGEARWREFRHSAPVAPGDSGGPVIDGHGRLLGVNSQIYVVPLLWRNQVWFYKASAYGPDPAWLHSLLERDRIRHR